MHLMDLNHKVKEGVEKAGLIGYQFNTVGVRYDCESCRVVVFFFFFLADWRGYGNSDGISMGTKGMRYSLQSRDLIADSIEVGGVGGGCGKDTQRAVS